ncbi:MAG TPA: hypothetical protein VG225_13850 [Terracidiphilus sp.]|jgi:hypothetical protein|nr:hypothetical protein [Terracidiphilus sp.]
MTDIQNTLPPLPIATLRRVQRIQKTMEKGLNECRYPSTRTLDVRRALEIMRSGVAEELNIRLDYFETVHGFEWAWMAEIITHATASVLACFPQGQFEKRDESNALLAYEGDQQFLDELIKTAWDYVVERRIKKGNLQVTSSENPEDWFPSALQKGGDQSQSRKRPMEDAKEVAHRAKLLAEYKAATGNPSAKRIYESSRAGIYKPQFYQWRKGTLPSESETAKNFERFLAAKKPPIPRKPKS